MSMPDNEETPGGATQSAPDADASTSAPPREATDAGPAPSQGSTSEEAGLVAVAVSPEAEIERLRQENQSLRDQVLRRRAEFENFRRRTERERQTWALDAEAGVIAEVITAIDHLRHALKSDAGEAALREGVELTWRDLMGSLAKLGLEVHDPVGRPFDPLVHQALSQEDAPEVEAGTVLETYRVGYGYKGRLLRPALVKVANGAPSGEPSPPGQGGGQPDGAGGSEGTSVGGPEAVH